MLNSNLVITKIVNSRCPRADDVSEFHWRKGRQTYIRQSVRKKFGLSRLTLHLTEIPHIFLPHNTCQDSLFAPWNWTLGMKMAWRCPSKPGLENVHLWLTNDFSQVRVGPQFESTTRFTNAIQLHKVQDPQLSEALNFLIFVKVS